MPLRPRTGAGRIGGPLVHLAQTTSTNDVGRTLAQAGAPAGTVVVAERQTAGRGRQGRAWSTPPGQGLTLSVVARLEPGGFDLLPLACALAICEACERVAPVSCAIKWPNDVWIDERKVAGILIEARPQERWAVIGIGVNVNTAAAGLGPDLALTATSLLLAANRPVDREAVLDEMLDRLADWLENLTRSDSQTLLDAYRKRDALSGCQIAWAASETRREGHARGIDERGNLVVFTDSGERVVLEAGEVHLIRR